MKDCKLCVAGIADIPRIQGMAEIAFRDTYRTILTPEQMEYMMDWMYSDKGLTEQMTVNGHRYLIAVDADGSDVGYVSFNKEWERDGYSLFHLQKIYVLPAMKGRGIGAMLLKAAEKAMLEMADTESVGYELNVNRNNVAKGFYEHMGLCVDRTGDFDIGNGFYMNDFIMAKKQIDR